MLKDIDNIYIYIYNSIKFLKKGELNKMKIRKILIGLTLVFSLASVSMSVYAKSSGEPKAYIGRLIKKAENDEEKGTLIALFNLQRAFGECVKIKEDTALKNFIKENFVKPKRELKNFNKKDLIALLDVLNAKIEKYENYIENNPQEKLTNEYAKNNIDFLKEVVVYVKKLKNNEISKQEVNTLLKVLAELGTTKFYADFDYDKPNSNHNLEI